MNRRGFVLLAVLVVVAAAILVATGCIFAARSVTANARAAQSEQRMRDAALDGVALAMDALGQQRRAILRGANPLLDPSLLVRGEGSERIEVTLSPMSGGALFESESAKLDFNVASEASIDLLLRDSNEECRMLVDAMLASRPRTSIDGSAVLLPVSERVRVLRDLLGPLRELDATNLSSGRRDTQQVSAGSTPPLVSIFTVHARESLVDRDGNVRLDVPSALGGDGVDAERAAAALRAFDDTETEALEQAARTNGVEPDDGAIAKELLARGVAINRVAEILDRATLHAGVLAPARLDVLRAEEAVLSAADGLGAEIASRIVDVRDTLDDAERADTSWLVTRRVLSGEEYAIIAGRIASRSLTWRFRIVASVVAVRDTNDGDAQSRMAAVPDTESRGPLAVYDAIVDIGQPTPRLVYLRDVSLADTARSLARASGREESIASVEREVASSERFPLAASAESPPELFSSSVEPATLPNPDLPSRARLRAVGRDVGGGR